MPFVESHLAAFKASLSQSLPTSVGLPPRSWGQSVLHHLHTDVTLPEAPVSREDLFQMAQNRQYNTTSFAISVLAWGGMDRRHGRMLFANSVDWLPIVDDLRSGRIESRAAYQAFYKLRLEGRLPGMGPAFYTKLIFFSHPSHDGFIMDQWTARSANLLLGKRIVSTIQSSLPNGFVQHRVADENTADTYAEFNEFIRILAKTIGYAGREDKVEEALFSTGYNKGVWRNYVKKHG